MEFNDYQAATAATALYPHAGRRTTLALTHVGSALDDADVQAKVTKLIHANRNGLTTARRRAIFDELGDLLWYVARTAEEIDAPLNNVAEANLAKFYDQPRCSGPASTSRPSQSSSVTRTSASQATPAVT